MSYLDQAQDPRRSTKALVAVGAIHAAIGYALLTGLTVGDVEKVINTRLTGGQIPLPPPPPDPTPTPTSAAKPATTKPVAPPVPIPFPPPPGPAYDPFDPDEIAAVDVSVRPDPGPTFQPLPPRPAPSFTPKPARPGNDKSRWITTDDYPRQPLMDEIEGTTGYRVAVGANGRVASCEIVAPSGNRALDAATCKHIASRARFEAATDGTGAKVAGTYSGTVHWEIPD